MLIWPPDPRWVLEGELLIGWGREGKHALINGWNADNREVVLKKKVWTMYNQDWLELKAWQMGILTLLCFADRFGNKTTAL